MNVTRRVQRPDSGFTLIELMMVITLIAIIAGIAIPMFLRSRMSANETAAIAMLKAIQSAQYQAQSRSAVDSDGDGSGEYAYLGELAGVVPARVSIGGIPAEGQPLVDELDPTMVSAAIANFEPDAFADGIITKNGYAYKLFLPGETLPSGETVALPEAATGGMVAGTPPDPDNCETLWACYAWPLDPTRTGKRAFFINQEGELLQYDNRNSQYGGITSEVSVPSFDAALAESGNMTAPLAVNAEGADGNVWTPVQ